MIKKYKCDPSLNTECSKHSCYIIGGMCQHTGRKECEKLNYFDDVLKLTAPQKKAIATILNKTIENAILYGGDPGGPYFDSTSKEKLLLDMRHITETFLKGYGVTFEGEYPKFTERW